MRTITVKLPGPLGERLGRAVVRRRSTRSAVVREALEAYLAAEAGRSEGSCFDLASDLAGAVHLSELVERAARGEEVVIAKAGEPRARLVPLARPVKHRKAGGWKGRVVVSPDFDTPLPEEILAAFEGRR